MSELLVSVDFSNPVVLAVLCALLCVLGLALSLGLQLASGLLDLLGAAISGLLEILAGGPAAWCGCLALLLILGGGAALAILFLRGLASCGTTAAMNFCVLLGR